MGYPFDKITHLIEEFVKVNSEEIHNINQSTRDEIYHSFRDYKNKWLSIVTTESLISESKKFTIKKIKNHVTLYTTEMWYIIIRRFPNKAFPYPIWQFYSTLAVLKWSNNQNTSTVKIFEDKIKHSNNVGIEITNDLILNCIKLAFYCSYLGELIHRQRWVGKGLKLFITDKLELILSKNQNIIDSVIAYDKRRPQNMLFGETGSPFLTNNNNNKTEIIFLHDTLDSIPIYIPKQNLTLKFNRFFTLIEIRNMTMYLNPYREAILDLYHIDIEAIVHTYYALSQKIINTLPINQINVNNERIEIDSDPTKSSDNHRLNFLFGICHKAYLRFPLNSFKGELSKIPLHPLISSEKSSEQLIEEFFRTFLLDDQKRDDIDFLSVNNPPVIFLNQNNLCYWDLQYFYDFIRSLIDNSKNWFSSQHGDRFTLIIKTYLEKELKGLSTIFFNEMMIFKKDKFDIDLLVQYKSKLFLIEAKAFAKNRAFWSGHRDAITRRSARIKNAVKQVLRSKKLLNDSIKSGLFKDLSNYKDIEWILCFPEQEFVHPPDRYGLINGIPRVCSLEELVKIIHISTQTHKNPLGLYDL